MTEGGPGPYHDMDKLDDLPFPWTSSGETTMCC